MCMRRLQLLRDASRRFVGSWFNSLLRMGFLFILIFGFSAGLLKGQEPIKILTIGNSFANDSIFYLEDIGAADGIKISVCAMNLGGHTLAQHASYIESYDASPTDPSGSPYRNPFEARSSKISLRQALEKEQWQYVTIQQASAKSCFPESYEPFADIIIKYIRKYAPQAEILVLETWAYRSDHGFFKNVGFDQQTMYAKLHSAYQSLGARYDLRVIPIGTAFQNARRIEPWKTFLKDPGYDYTSPKPEENPNEVGDLTLGWIWRTDQITKKRKFSLDGAHANVAGRFLAAATLYEVLTGRNVKQNTFVPSGLSPQDAALLREVANDTIKNVFLETKQNPNDGVLVNQ